MAEELRFFLRTAVYSAGIAIIYWFSSRDPTGAYDPAGTALLTAAAVAAAGVVVVMSVLAREALAASPRPLARRLAAWLSLTDPGGAADRRPLGSAEPLPRSSAWPVLGALAATLIGLGLVFGAWLWIPGLALMASTAWGWVTQLRR